MIAPALVERPMYHRHAAASDRGHWTVERDVDWSAVEVDAALAQPELLAALRDAAVIEGFHPVNLTRLIRCFWDDVDACVVFSLEMYEGFRHFHALRRYLDHVGYAPRITDEELVASRRGGIGREIPREEGMAHLVEFMLSEHLAAYFFRRLSEQAGEPVLREMLARIAADEVRHAQAASDLIAKRVAADPSVRRTVLQAALDFRHYGEEAVGPVPVAMPGDEVAIRTFARRIERLCGVRLVDFIKEEL
jgi:hypothetical protein